MLISSVSQQNMAWSLVGRVVLVDMLRRNKEENTMRKEGRKLPFTTIKLKAVWASYHMTHMNMSHISNCIHIHMQIERWFTISFSDVIDLIPPSTMIVFTKEYPNYNSGITTLVSLINAKSFPKFIKLTAHTLYDKEIN